jgi:hypothetical protein
MWEKRCLFLLVAIHSVNRIDVTPLVMLKAKNGNRRSVELT